MPALNPGDFHIDAILSGMLEGYRPTDMIADGIFPVINVNKQSNIYAKVNRGNWFRNPTTLRAPGTAPREVSYTVSSDTYKAENHELATVVAFETIDNADDPWNPMVLNGQFLIDQLMLGYEIRTYDTIIGGVGSSMSRTGTDAWDDYGNSSPLEDMDVAREAIRRNTQKRPNVAIMGEKAWIKVKRHPDLLKAAIPGGLGGGVLNEQQMAGLIGVDKFLIGRLIKNTAEEGAADTFTDVWSTNLIMAHVAPAPGIMVPSFGYAFRWTGPNIGARGPGSFAVETRRDTKRKVVEMQTGYYQDEKISAAELGFLINTGITE